MAKRKKSMYFEDTRIWASRFLEEFRASKNDSHEFEQHLSTIERRIIHNMCRRMGIGSKSTGLGVERRLSIFKNKEGKGDEEGDASGNKKQHSVGDASGKKKQHSKGVKESSKAKLECVKESTNEKLKFVSFPPEAKAVLQELFTHYPPCDDDTTEKSLGIYTGHLGNQRKWKDDFFLKPQFNKQAFLKRVASLSSRLEKNKRFREIFEARSKLPIACFRDAITSAVESNQVVLIAGETGCGKTTQVPQYLLDHMWSSQSKACKIICTQPRRISAISVSERISCERGEPIGETIGYKVRLQSKGGRQSSVVFCTNGILLRVLVGKGGGSCIPDITHIIVDEIHERDCYSDFMLAIIRDFLPSNPHLRLILMSATLDAERFSGYFGGCPVVRVPGFTYPVRTFYLEDVLSVLKSAKNNHLISADSNIPDGKRDCKDEDKVALDEAIDLAWKNDEFYALLDLVSSEGSHDIYNYRQSLTGLTPLMVFAGKGRVSDVCKLLSFGADCNLKSNEGITALELAEKEKQLETAQIIREHADNFQSNSQQAQDLLDKYVAKINQDEVDLGLIVQLMMKICSDSEVGAILVFLPGWEEIRRTKEKLLATPFFANDVKFSIICLHSKVPTEEQAKVFKLPTRGCRKIVLSTNIAESAVTIDDVVFVIDSGRMKEKSYDPYNDVSTLQSSWVSKANAKQRRGRAGRCQPGICYHLFSKLRAASLPEFRVPEVRRMPVDELCLQVKMLDPSCSINYFLQKLMDPPVAQCIANAITILKDIGALTPQEELTELGHKFGQLPVHPRISKMLFFAILVNCLDPALIIACSADTKDPFIMPLLPGDRKKANDAKLELASLYGGYSDHLATVAAFHCWKNAKISGLSNEFCSQYFVSSNAMRMLDNMCEKLRAELKRNGSIPLKDSSSSLNAHDPGILRAVLAVGLYPMVGRLCPSPMNNRRSLVETITGAKVGVPTLAKHLNMSSTKYDESIIVFDEITQGDWDMRIRSCTVLHTIPLLLFSRDIAVAPRESCAADKSDDEEDHKVENVADMIDIDSDRCGEKIMLEPENSVKVVVDRWLTFEITAFEIAQLYILRERLLASILFKVKHPLENLPPHLGASMYAIACILSYDGLEQPSVRTVAVEQIASSVYAKSLRDDIPSANPSGIQEHDPNTTPIGSKLESANKLGLDNMEGSLPSNLANWIEQPDFNTAPVEAVSAAKHQKMRSKSEKRKSVNNVDLGNMEENTPSNLANGSEQTEPKSASNLDLGNMEENTPDLANEKTEPKSVNDVDLENMEKNTPDLANEKTGPKSANKLDLENMEYNIPSDLANGNEQTEPDAALMKVSVAKQQKKKRSRSKRQKSAINLDLANIDDNTPADLANGNEQTEPKSVNNVDFGNMEKNNTPSDLANGNEKTEPKSVDNVDLGNMEESMPCDLVNGNEQAETNTAPMEAAPVAKQPKKKRSRSKRQKGNTEERTPSDLAIGNEQTEPKSVDNVDLGNMEENIPFDMANGNEQTQTNTAPMEAASVAKQTKKKRTRSKRQKSTIDLDLGNTDENSPSDLADGNVQAETNTAPVDAASVAKQPKKKRSRSKRQKSAVDLDFGNMDKSTPSDLAIENEKTEPKSTIKLDLENQPDLGNMEESLPSNLANGDEQLDPNTARLEAVSVAKQQKKKRSRSERRKLVNNVDLGNMEESNTPSYNGNEQTESKSSSQGPMEAAKQSKSSWWKSSIKMDLGNMEENMPSNLANRNDEQTEPKSVNDLDLGNMEENKPSNLANGNEQAEPKSVNKLNLENNPDLGNMEKSLPSNIANGDEQPDPNTVPTEAVSAANQPKKKQSRRKKRKSANNIDAGNNMPSTNGIGQPDLDSSLTEAASMAKQQNIVVQTEQKSENKSDLIEVKVSNEQFDPNIAPTEAASMENN